MSKLNSEKFSDSINAKWGRKICPMCGHNNWSTDGKLWSPMKADGEISIGGEILPLVPVTCTNCGNTVFVNAKIIECIEE